MIDVKSQLNAVRRTVSGRTLAVGEARVSTISQVYATDIDDLWEVVTTAERIERWFLPVSGELVEGGSYQLTGNAGGTITRCDRPHGFDATWEFGGATSWIEVRLAAESVQPAGSVQPVESVQRTRFTLEHISIVSDELWDQFGPGAAGIGWDGALFGLAGHLADPTTALDPAKAMQWLGTDEGKAMLRGSSNAWVAAAVADGTDPELAAERGQRCDAFYTGAA